MSDEGTTVPPTSAPQAQQPGSPTSDTAPAHGGKGEQEPAWLPERLERARKAALSDLLRELGVANPDELKAAMQELSKLKAAQMTEMERAQKALSEAQQRAEAAEQELQRVQQQARQERLETAIRTAASAAQARYPEDVVVWARTSGDNLDALLDKSGKVSTEAVKALVEKARAARPEWFKGSGPGVPSNANARLPEASDALRLQGRAGMQSFVRRNW
jgi:alanyl-tRNA synthetase